MNEVIETILAHRSVRSFEDRKLTKEQIETIVRCAQAGATSSYVQAYSILGVTDYDIKQRLANIVGNQQYVADNGHLFVFCADLHRHEVIGEMEEADVLPSVESTEKFMVGIIDATIAAQNAALAAESMGLGICYIGGLRNDLPAVCELLEIPSRIVPLFGMVVGYPKKVNQQKPRLPLTHLYRENRYQAEQSEYIKQLENYNKTVQDYYIGRTNGKRSDTWTSQVAQLFEKKNRMYMHDFVEKQGLNKR